MHLPCGCVQCEGVCAGLSCTAASPSCEYCSLCSAAALWFYACVPLPLPFALLPSECVSAGVYPQCIPVYISSPALCSGSCVGIGVLCVVLRCAVLHVSCEHPQAAGVASRARQLCRILYSLSTSVCASHQPLCSQDLCLV